MSGADLCGQELLSGECKGGGLKGNKEYALGVGAGVSMSGAFMVASWSDFFYIIKA